jgi:hypothetical protein
MSVTRSQLNNNLTTTLQAVVEIPAHLQTYQMILDYVDQEISGVTYSLSGLSLSNYYNKQEVDAIAGTKSFTGHTHPISGVTGLQTVLNTLSGQTISGLTAGRVAVAGSATSLTDYSGLTFNGTNLNVIGNIQVIPTVGTNTSAHLLKNDRLASTVYTTATGIGSELYEQAGFFRLSYGQDFSEAIAPNQFNRILMDGSGVIISSRTGYGNSIGLVVDGANIGLSSSGATISTLAGTGTRMVVALPNGTLSTQAISGGTSGATVSAPAREIVYGNGTGVTSSSNLTFSGSSLNVLNSVVKITPASGTTGNILDVTKYGGSSILKVKELEGTYHNASVTIDGQSGTNQFALLVQNIGGGDAGVSFFGASGRGFAINSFDNTPTFAAVNNGYKFSVTDQAYDSHAQAYLFECNNQSPSVKTFVIKDEVSNGYGSKTGSYLEVQASATNIFSVEADYKIKGAVYSGATNALTYFDSDGKVQRSSINPSIVGKTYLLNSQFVSTGNTTSGTTDLMSYTIPANQLATNGDLIEFDMSFSIAANANSKEIFFYVAGSGTYYSTIPSGQAYASGKIIRTDSTHAKLILKVDHSNGSIYYSSVGPFGYMASSSQVLKAQVTSALLPSDIIQDSMQVKYFGL